MKLNNKGFAISTLIYGLSIMGMMLISILMGIMAVNRSNNRTLSNEIEEDLNRFSKTSTSFSASGTGQKFTVPIGESGWYRIELLGASGGSGSGGLGAYTSGVIELEEEDELYFYVGSQTAGSGGSTDVRIISESDSKYTTQQSYNSRIMVAAGGGKNPGSNGGTLYGYNSSMVATDGKLNLDPTGTFGLASGTTTLVGYPSNYSITTDLNFKNNTPIPDHDGGSGFNSSNSADIGGVSFIAGYAGAKGTNLDSNNTTWSANDSSVVAPYEWYDEETNETTDGYKPYYFVDGVMFSGVNKGNGKAKIERIARKTNPNMELVRSNPKLNNVSQIKDCVGGASDPVASTISATYMGEELVSGLSVSGKCVTATLKRTSDLDEIAVWHEAGKDYTDNIITVISNGSTKTIKDKGKGSDKLSETESPVGYRVSAYQPDMTQSLPLNGNYYIIPVLTENKALSAQADSDNKHNPIKIEYINGYKRQKWSIQRIVESKVVNDNYNPNDPNTYEYRIIDLARFRALNILKDENRLNNEIGAALEFNNKRRNAPQIWKINPMGNGTYTISTIVPRFSALQNTGNVFPQMDMSKDGKEELLIGINNDNTERFKLISIDYSSS